MLNAGDAFPAFSLPDQDGTSRRLADLKGENGLILYVYPKDDTPGCTVEAQDFRSHEPAIGAKGYRVAGLSMDSAESHCKFIEKYQLSFPLLSDAGGDFLRSIGSYGDKNMYGRIVTGILRSTFVIGADGKLLKVYRNVRASGHAARVAADLR